MTFGSIIDHKNILEYSGRPFETVPDMNQTLIKNIKKVVKPGDVLIIVGDVSLGAKKTDLREYIKEIKSTGITLGLVRGNHDYKNNEMMNMGFDFAFDKLELEIAKERVTVMHYPYRGPVLKYYYYKFMSKFFPKKFWKERYYWDKLPYREKYLIHGHTHSTELQNEFQINVSAEAVNYTPISIYKIAELIQKHKNKRIKLSWFDKLFKKRKIFRDHSPRRINE